MRIEAKPGSRAPRLHLGPSAAGTARARVCGFLGDSRASPPGHQIWPCLPPRASGRQPPPAVHPRLSESGDHSLGWLGRGWDGVFLPSSGPSKPELVQRVLSGWKKKKDLHRSLSPGGRTGKTAQDDIFIFLSRLCGHVPCPVLRFFLL